MFPAFKSSQIILYIFSYVHYMNLNIREKKKEIDIRAADGLKVCNVDIKQSLAQWKEIWTRDRFLWLLEAERCTYPEDILYRKARKVCRNLVTGARVPVQPENLPDATHSTPQSLEQALENAKSLQNDESQISKWTRSHYDILWYLMIEKGLTVNPSKLFAVLARLPTIKDIWPVSQRISDGGSMEKTVRDTLRTKWSKLALWALGCPQFINDFDYNDESRLNVLELLKEGLPKPKDIGRWLTKLRQTNPDATYETILERRIEDMRKEKENAEMNEGAENLVPQESQMNQRHQGGSQVENHIPNDHQSCVRVTRRSRRIVAGSQQ